MTLDELKQHLIDIYNEAIQQQHECIKGVTKAEVYVSASRPNIVNVDLWRGKDDDFVECYAFELKDGKPYCIDDDMPVDFSSLDTFFMNDVKEEEDKKEPEDDVVNFFKQHFYVQTDDETEPDYVAHHWLICKDVPYLNAIVAISQQEFEALSTVLEAKHEKLHIVTDKVMYE